MFYFAWVDPDETTFETEHEREDEKVLSLAITQAEGEFASLSIDIKNPRVGLLAASRKRWAWLSWKAPGDVTGDAVPLFFGRLIGIPSDLQAEVITMELIARPQDWNDQRSALASTMKVFPYWDPAWFDAEARDNPDSVLEGYTKLWHTDRVTHVVTASDILTGEDGTLDVSGGFFRDSLRVSYDKIPGRRVSVRATAQWNQEAAGSINFTQAIADAFHTIGGYGGSSYLIASYTGQGLMDDWPKKGNNIGGGWTVGEGTLATRVDGRVNAGGDQEVVQTENGKIVSFPVWTLKGEFVADYKASRGRIETVEFTLEADVQALLTEPGDEETIQLDLTSEKLNELVDPGDLAPIRDPARRTYFQTDRGWRSIEHLIARARAILLARSRACLVTVQLPWEVALGASLRKTGLFEDARLPCGQAAGKIISYELSASGDTGELLGEVTIACPVGKGNAVTADGGDPTYVEDGYVQDGYQVRVNRVVAPVAGEVTYVPPEGVAVQDDGLDFSNLTVADVLLPIEGTNTEVDEPGIDVLFGPAAQQGIIAQGGGDMSAVTEALNQAYTIVRVNLKPLTRGPYEQTYVVEVSDLMVPKAIDLECEGEETTT